NRSDSSQRHTSTRLNAANSSSDREFEARNRAFRATAIARRDRKSLSVAASEAETTPKNVLKRAHAAWRKKARQWAVTENDNYIRHLQIPGEHGPIVVR